jgi:hypothetical protein
VAQGGDHHRPSAQAKKKAEIAGWRTKNIRYFFVRQPAISRPFFACVDVEEEL